MTEERLKVIAANAIGLLEERVFDNYETEVLEALGIDKDEYCEIMGCDWDEDDYISDEQMETIKTKCAEELINGTEPKYLVGCIYGLYVDYIISEEQEIELYKLVDPDELYNEPSEYWGDIKEDNPLAECIGY